MIFHNGGRFLKYLEIQKILQSLDSYFRDRMQIIIGNFGSYSFRFPNLFKENYTQNTSKCLMSKRDKSIQIWAWECAYYFILEITLF